MRAELTRPLAAAAALSVLALTAAACGGDEDRGDRAAAAPGPARAAPPSQPHAQPALVGASEVPELRPGRVLADSGFDVRRDGFSFENYTTSLGGPHLRPQEMQEMFGNGVCAAGTSGEGCTLRPAADRWRKLGTEFVFNGHCYGFSVLSLQLRAGIVEQSLYGAGPSTWDLRLTTARGLVINPELQADLERSAVSQFVTPVKDQERAYSPNEAVEVLREGLPSGTGWVLSISSPDPTKSVGHAVVPIRLEDMGEGKVDVVLYDNNFPYVGDDPDRSTRRLHIDTKTNSWEYVVSTTPDAKEDKWFGKGTDNRIRLIREEAHRLPLPCPVCGRRGLGQTMVGLTGDAVKHGHLRITDAQGRVAGFDGGELVNEIPGVKVYRPLLSKIWLAEPEPVYMLPRSGRYEIELVDVPDDAPEQTIQAAGGDIGVGLTGLTADDEGTKLEIGDDGAVALTPGGEDPIAGQLQVAAGSREIQVDPSAEPISLRPAAGDLIVRGSAERVGVVDVRGGAAVTARRTTGRIDLDRLMGP